MPEIDFEVSVVVVAQNRLLIGYNLDEQLSTTLSVSYFRKTSKIWNLSQSKRFVCYIIGQFFINRL